MTNPTPHRFGALKSVAGVQKVATFDMFKAQQAAHRGGLLSQQQVDFCSGGTCAGHTMNWLQSSLASPKGLASAYTSTSKASREEMFPRVAADIVPHFIVYKKSMDDNALKQLADAFKLDLTLPDQDLLWGTHDLADCLDTVSGLGVKQRDGGYYLSIDASLNGLEASHGLGVIRSSKQSIRFFEPNAGEYLVPNAAIKRFCSEYLAAYAKFGWKLGRVTCSQVSPPLCIDFL